MLELRPELLVEVVDRERAVDPDVRLVEPLDRLVREVELVLDLADDLLEQVLERDDALHRAVLVDDDRHVLVRAPELGEQRRRGPSSRARCRPAAAGRSSSTSAIAAVVQRGEEVADVEDRRRSRRASRGRPGSACRATRAARASASSGGRSTEIATTSGRGTITSCDLLVREVEDLVEHLLLGRGDHARVLGARDDLADVLLGVGEHRRPAAGWTPKRRVTAFAKSCSAQTNGLVSRCRNRSGNATARASGSARWSAIDFGTSSPSATLR